MLRSIDRFAIAVLLTGCIAAQESEDEEGDTETSETETSDTGEPEAACPEPNGVVIEHREDIETDETWAGDGTEHHVISTFTVRPGATLTLDPCADVRIAENQGIIVRGDDVTGTVAELVASGTESQPIRIGRLDDELAWGSLRGYNFASFLELRHVEIAGGGADPTQSFASVSAYGTNDWSNPTPVLAVDHVVIEGSQGPGVLLGAAGSFTPDSTELTITGGGAGQPTAGVMTLGIMAVATIPIGSYTGNERDEITVLQPTIAVTSDLTIPDRGVPYHITGSVLVGIEPVTGPLVLTIEPGVELRMAGVLTVGITGAAQIAPRLIAMGTEEAQIVFTSDEEQKAPGDWPGIWLRYAKGSRLDHVRIEYAGGENGIVSSNCAPEGSGDEAALILGNFLPVVEGGYVPSGAELTNSVISATAGHGINSVWVNDEPGPSFAFSNTIESGGDNTCAQTKNGLLGFCDDRMCLEP